MQASGELATLYKCFPFCSTPEEIRSPLPKPFAGQVNELSTPTMGTGVNAPVAGASVVLTGSSGGPLSLTTDASGHYAGIFQPYSDAPVAYGAKWGVTSGGTSYSGPISLYTDATTWLGLSPADSAPAADGVRFDVKGLVNGLPASASLGLSRAANTQILIPRNAPSGPLTTDPRCKFQYNYFSAIDKDGNTWVDNSYNPSGNAYVSKLSPSGALLSTTTVGKYSWHVTTDPSGNAWAANLSDNTVTKIAPNGAVVGTYSVPGYPFAIASDSGGNIWVSTSANGPSGVITKLSPSGAILGTFAGPGAAPFYYDIRVDHDDNVWATDIGGAMLVKFSSSGALITTALGPNIYAYSLAIDSSNNVWATDITKNTVSKVSPSGALIGSYRTGTAPWGVSTDSSGNAWVVNIVGDAGISGGTVSQISAGGALMGTYSAGKSPYGINVDSSGNPWINNSGPDGTLTRLSPNGASLGTVNGCGGPFAGVSTINITSVDSPGFTWWGEGGMSVSASAAAGMIANSPMSVRAMHKYVTVRLHYVTPGGLPIPADPTVSAYDWNAVSYPVNAPVVYNRSGLFGLPTATDASGTTVTQPNPTAPGASRLLVWTVNRLATNTPVNTLGVADPYKSQFKIHVDSRQMLSQPGNGNEDIVLDDNARLTGVIDKNVVMVLKDIAK